MVKNAFGGNKAKGQARKNQTMIKQPSTIRLSENDELELYAQVFKMLGNGMCHVLCIDGEIRLCYIRGKFRGRGKRDNFITINSWVLVGLREWELDNKNSSKMQACDLLEVYLDTDKDNLKSKVHANWSLFDANDRTLEKTDIVFADESTTDYLELIEKEALNKNISSKSKKIEYDEINVDDI